jgi:hypothetical protein
MFDHVFVLKARPGSLVDLVAKVALVQRYAKATTTPASSKQGPPGATQPTSP